MDDGCHEGWLKFQRSWLYDENIWLTGAFSKQKAWIDLVARAEFRQTEVNVRGIRVLVGRGQLAASERSNRIRWRWSKNKILRYQNELEAEQQIIIHRSNVINVIQIVEYDEIMGKGTTKGTTDGATGGATEPEKRSNSIYIEEEIKKFKEGKEYTPLPPNFIIFSFDKFFYNYGKNVNYEKCRYIWGKLKPEDHEAIFNHFPKYVESTPDKRFRKDPDKYLEEKIWKNEIINYGKQQQQQRSTKKDSKLLEKIAREAGRHPGKFTDE